MNLADTLNLGCLCRTLNTGRLREQLETDPSLKGLASELAQTRPANVPQLKLCSICRICAASSIRRCSSLGPLPLNMVRKFS